MRSATNVYYPQVLSAIYIPRTSSDRVQELLELMGKAPLSGVINTLLATGQVTSPASFIRNSFQDLMAGFQESQIDEALTLIKEAGSAPASESGYRSPEESDLSIRHEEYEVLKLPQHSRVLVAEPVEASGYEEWFARYFDRMMLIKRLRETRVFAGFSRIYPTQTLPVEERDALLWRNPPSRRESWLPAYSVLGEGLLFLFREETLSAWEGSVLAARRAARLWSNYETAGGCKTRQPGPRFILLHTFAHLLINRLAFECGYSSASMRERLYCASEPEKPMAGVLIYTAVGDAEGTMGGLVRMGKPATLEPVLLRALENAFWCSADPVCMEMGNGQGQGPCSCNLAACHNCALLPETSCERFNSFLDRGMVIGDWTHNGLGFFEDVPSTKGA